MMERNYDIKKKKLIENLSWAAFILVLAFFLLFRSNVPDGLWYIALGVILIAMNLGKAIINVPLSLMTFGAGVIILLVGVSDYLGVDVSLGPIILIVIAASIALRSIMGYRK